RTSDDPAVYVAVDVAVGGRRQHELHARSGQRVLDGNRGTADGPSTGDSETDGDPHTLTVAGADALAVPDADTLTGADADAEPERDAVAQPRRYGPLRPPLFATSCTPPITDSRS